MKFFQDRLGRHYPVSEIARICEYEGKRERGALYYDSVRMKDGLDLLVSSSVRKNLTERAGETIPAQPGFTLLKMWYSPQYDDSAPHVSDTPVLGWILSSAEGVLPVTIDEETYDDRCGILCPDGKVRTFDTRYDTQADWERDMIAEQDRRHADRLAQKAQLQEAAQGEVSDG